MKQTYKTYQLAGIVAAFSLFLLFANPCSAAYRLTVGIAPFEHDESTLKEQPSVLESEEEEEGMLIQGVDGDAIVIQETDTPQEEVVDEKESASLEKPDFERASLEIRNAEALVLQNYLRELLEKDGGDCFEAVINAPAGVDESSSFAASVDLWVQVSVEAANAEEFRVKVTASSSAGETLMNEKKFGQNISKGVFVKKDKTLKEGYHKTLSEVAQTIVATLQKKNRNGDFDRYEDFTNLKFAVYMAPETFERDDYLNRRGNKIKSLPSEDDIYFREALEARLATLDIYQNFDEQVVAPGRKQSYTSYGVWRYRSFLAASKYLEAQKEIEKRQAENRIGLGAKILLPVVLGEVVKNNDYAEKVGLGPNSDKKVDAVVAAQVLKTLLETFKLEDGRIVFDEERLAQSDDAFARNFIKRRAEIEDLSFESQDHADKLIELQKAFSDDLEPINIQYRGRSFTLTGQIEDKVAELQRILSDNYQESLS